MKSAFAAFILIAAVTTSAWTAPKGPQIDLIDNKLSVNVESIPLSRLLQLIDQATGMKSKVPAELANRNMNVRFAGLDMTDAVRKIFQGLPLDYVMVQGQGIIVTAASQTTATAGGDPVPQYNNQPVQPMDQPFVQEFPPPGGVFQPGQQPAMVQTPFGPVPNPRAQQPNVQNQQNPLVTPIQQQQNSLFPQTGQPINQPMQQPVQQVPGLQPGNPTPFGTFSGFGAPNVPPVQPNNLFQNSTGAQPR